MKIGIITFWWSNDNYGQILQAYALIKYLSDFGHDVQVIRFKPSRLSLRYWPKWFVHKGWKYIFNFQLFSRFIGRFNRKNNNETNRDFYLFRKDYLKFSKVSFFSYHNLEKNDLGYDAYICGSDKIWSSVRSYPIVYDNLDAFSLAFVKNPNSIKLSYAPSIGSTNFNEKSMKRLLQNLSNFNGISLREANTVEVFKSLGREDVVWVPDPTQLIGTEGYLHFFNSDSTEYQKTWFIYGLNNPSYITSNQIAKELLSKGVDFTYTGANGNIDELINCYPTIPEWLSYMYYANNIITNSYHGCIFCILFHKNFYYVPVLPDKNGLPDERVLSIMNRYEIKDRAIQSLEELQQIIAHPYRPIEWDSVDAKREEFVQIGKDFLAKHLGDSSI